MKSDCIAYIHTRDQLTYNRFCQRYRSILIPEINPFCMLHRLLCTYIFDNRPTCPENMRYLLSEAGCAVIHDNVITHRKFLQIDQAVVPCHEIGYSIVSRHTRLSFCILCYSGWTTAPLSVRI